MVLLLAAELKAVFLAFASFGSGQVSIDVAAIARGRPTTAFQAALQHPGR